MVMRLYLNSHGDWLRTQFIVQPFWESIKNQNCAPLNAWKFIHSPVCVKRKTNVDEYRIDQALKAYERIENGLVEFSEHVPIIVGNETIQSPALVSGIVDACGLLDRCCATELLIRLSLRVKPSAGEIAISAILPIYTPALWIFRTRVASYWCRLPPTEDLSNHGRAC